ncbi:2OG-Fe(II) oxygenase, partial [Rhodanobacter terrae]
IDMGYTSSDSCWSKNQQEGWGTRVNFRSASARKVGQFWIGLNSPAYERLDDAIKSPEFLKAVGELTGIEGLIYDPWYLGGGTHENRNGMSLDPHVDFNYHPSEKWHRRLNLIIYLNPTWDDSWGGCLEIFRDPYADNRPSRAVSPAFNRCVIFETSEKSWHGFDAIRLPDEHADISRRSIALYFYLISVEPQLQVA